MRFYHFTRLAYLPSILKDGVDTGQVCVALRHHLNGVWLTTSSSPHGHGLSGSDDATKLECRIEVEIDRNDPHLHRYRRWARDIGLDREFMKVMRKVAGQGADDSSWYIYFGTIKPQFASMTYMSTGEPLIDVPADVPVMRGVLDRGSTLVSADDLKAGKIDLKFDPADAVLVKAAAFPLGRPQ